MLKRSACLYTSNTGVGLTSDVSLIRDLLYEDYEIDIVYQEFGLDNNQPAFANYDIGIFIQDFDIPWIERNKINVLIANEEWISREKFPQLKHFDKILTKSTFAKHLLAPYNNNIVTTGFCTIDKNLPDVNPTKTFFHVGGKSYQKNTEDVLKCFKHKNLELTLLQSQRTDLEPTSNVNFIQEYIPDEKIKLHFNDHSIHLCPSICEGWGHYLYEGMSTGALIYATKLPVFLEWIDPELVVFLDCMFHTHHSDYPFLHLDNREETYWPHHVGWVVDCKQLNDAIINHKKHLENHKPEKVKTFFKHINEQNSKKIYTELTNI